jgi:choline dehydrogenase-like flavoprotein
MTATGVQLSISGKEYTIPARKEFILAPGSSQTPQLLGLSGIGDAGLLRSYGIDAVIVLRGVGENLQDHANVSFAYEVADGMPSADGLREPEFAAWGHVVI